MAEFEFKICCIYLLIHKYTTASKQTNSTLIHTTQQHPIFNFVIILKVKETYESEW